MGFVVVVPPCINMTLETVYRRTRRYWSIWVGCFVCIICSRAAFLKEVGSKTPESGLDFHVGLVPSCEVTMQPWRPVRKQAGGGCGLWGPVSPSLLINSARRMDSGTRTSTRDGMGRLLRHHQFQQFLENKFTVSWSLLISCLTMSFKFKWFVALLFAFLHVAQGAISVTGTYRREWVDASLRDVSDFQTCVTLVPVFPPILREKWNRIYFGQNEIRSILYH